MKENDKSIIILVLSSLVLVAAFGIGLKFFYPKEETKYNEVDVSDVKYSTIDFNVKDRELLPFENNDSKKGDLVIDGTVTDYIKNTSEPILKSLGKEIDKGIVSKIKNKLANDNKITSKTENAPTTEEKNNIKQDDEQLKIIGSDGRDYWIQVASLTKKDKTEELMFNIDSGSRVKGKISENYLNGTLYYRLRYGPFKNKQDADIFNEWLRKDLGIEKAYLMSVSKISKR